MEWVQYLSAGGHKLDQYAAYLRFGAYGALLGSIFLFGNLAPIPFLYFKF
jgi:hypothetical protein